jgi:tRNA U34 2-thiouridine synthase MnmA/TrmU
MNSTVAPEAQTDSSTQKKRPHAIALFSGGLDSALAILLLLKQNIEVTALTFMTHFGCDVTSDRSSCGSNPYPMADKYGFNVKLMHLGQKFVDIVVDPKFGRGANMNVCIDCRILMINEASRCMRLMDADFLVTGEVMGQRPMSQRKPIMNMVEKHVNLGGRLLRPLSAKLLPPTMPEKLGMIDREQLEGISGRSRKRQMELAKEFGLEDYPSPASGCLLTDYGYSARLKDLLAHTENITFEDLNLLRIGRQFRISERAKLILGRNHDDNLRLSQYLNDKVYRIEAKSTGSPVGMLYGELTDEDFALASSILARYTKEKSNPTVPITIERGVECKLIDSPPASEAMLDQYRIGG